MSNITISDANGQYTYGARVAHNDIITLDDIFYNDEVNDEDDNVQPPPTADVLKRIVSLQKLGKLVDEGVRDGAVAADAWVWTLPNHASRSMHLDPSLGLDNVNISEHVGIFNWCAHVYRMIHYGDGSIEQQVAGSTDRAEWLLKLKDARLAYVN